MKRVSFLPFWLMAALLFCVYSCGSNEKTDSEKTTTDTAATATTPAASESKPAATTTTEPLTVMLVTHKVKDFDPWKASYDAHDSMRLANGIHSYVIGRSVKDPNMVIVATKADDLGKAKAFAKNPSLKQAMQKGGVMGAPTIKFYVLTFRDSGQVNTDLRSSTTFTVKDWDHWQKSFDSTRQLNTDNGLVVRAYGHEADDNHKVTIVTAITDTAKAMAYWKSDLLKQRRMQSGVTTEPVRLIYHMVQRY